MKSLVVEDDEASRYLLENILSEFGDVHTAENGKYGLEAISDAIAQQDPFDIICLDIDMPEMNGQDMLIQLRTLEKRHEIPPHLGVKVIMVTIHNDSNNVLTAFREQCDAFCVKPITPEKLSKQLRYLELIAAVKQ
jgi:two-component system chemotaxis response regulator CheY